MGKIVGVLNMTVDGFCDHTSGIPDDELHRHYTQLLTESAAILYGRTTFELMEYWRGLLSRPSDQTVMNDFAFAIDQIPKIVFSATLKEVFWPTAAIAQHDLGTEIAALRKKPGKQILVGSRSLIVQALNEQLLDELQLCIHPMLAGGGLPLFGGINESLIFKLSKTKVFQSGALILYYRPSRKNG